MSEVKKLTEEEIAKVKNIRKNYVDIQNAFGQLHLTKINLEKQLSQIDTNYDSLTAEYEKTQTAEQELVKSIQDQYGVGTLNIESGTFTPSIENS
tara:strand:+ start:4484 stop:4768 length:285 start_codon:yes stop_codon:yes gene_type:complete